MKIPPRVVIIGSGFGGLKAARILARTTAEVMLLDRNNYHTFLPLLYQVAAAELAPEDIAYPMRSIVRGLRRVHFCMAEVKRVDFENRHVETGGAVLSYDYLIVGTGSTCHFFGVPGASEYTFPLKTMDQGIVLRNKILSCFERAVHERDRQIRQRALTFVIVGGGPTGIEFAGALAELVHGPLVRDYRRLDLQDVRIVLVEAMSSLLPGFPDRLGIYARRRLEYMKVDVRLHTSVSEVTPDAVRLRDGTIIPTSTVVWTAGVRGTPDTREWNLPAGPNGRVPVLPTLQIPDHPEVYVIGDLAYIEENGHPLPMLAPVAIQQGQAAAGNIVRQIAGMKQLPFRFRDPGTMITIGRNAAAVYLHGLSFTGFPAWILWLSVHIFELIGFRNRLLVLINWAWDYIFYERAVRLILTMGSAFSHSGGAQPGEEHTAAGSPESGVLKNGEGGCR